MLPRRPDEEEAEEEAEVEEQQPLPVLLQPRIQSATPHSEHNSPESSLGRLRESLDEHCGTLTEMTFHLPESPESDWFRDQKQEHEKYNIVFKMIIQRYLVPGEKTRQKTGSRSLMDVQTWGLRSSIFSYFWQYSTSRWTFTFFVTLSWFDSFKHCKIEKGTKSIQRNNCIANTNNGHFRSSYLYRTTAFELLT